MHDCRPGALPAAPATLGKARSKPQRRACRPGRSARRSRVLRATSTPAPSIVAESELSRRSSHQRQGCRYRTGHRRQSSRHRVRRNRLGENHTASQDLHAGWPGRRRPHRTHTAQAGGSAQHRRAHRHRARHEAGGEGRLQAAFRSAGRGGLLPQGADRRHAAGGDSIRSGSARLRHHHY